MVEKSSAVELITLIIRVVELVAVVANVLDSATDKAVHLLIG